MACDLGERQELRRGKPWYLAGVYIHAGAANPDKASFAEALLFQLEMLFSKNAVFQSARSRDSNSVGSSFKARAMRTKSTTATRRSPRS